MNLTNSLSIKSNLRSAGAIAPYTVLGISPHFVADFVEGEYVKNAGGSTFANAITHTRASTATYVDADGILQTAATNVPRIGHHVWNGSAWVNEGLLHESEARTNLLLRSEEFDDAVWLKEDFPTPTVTANATISPDGAATADKLVSSASGTPLYQGVTQTISALSAAGQFSVYLKPDEIFQCELRIFGGALFNVVLVDLSTESFISGTGVIADAGNGWYRVTISAPIGCTSFRVSLAKDGNRTFTPDGTSGLFVWGAQLEAAPTPSSYIPTAGSAVTRAADVLTVPAANLPYPTPTVIGPELVTNGTFDTDISGWINDSAAGGSIAWNPAGYIDIINATGTARVYRNATVQSGKIYLLSFDAIASPSAADFFYVGSTTNNAQILNGQGIVAGRNEFVFLATSTIASLGFRNFGTGTTTTLDNISVREINPLAVSIQMDGRVTYADVDTFGTAVFFRWGEPTGDRLLARLDTGSSRTGQIIFFQNNSGVTDFVETSETLYSPDTFVPFSLASRHGSTFINGAADGVALTANTTPTSLPNLSAANLNLGATYNGTIRTFRMWGQDITDAGLVEATAPSLVPSLSLTFDDTENSFIVEDWSE